ncbi:hypothetical protein PC116_g27944, partial [Phytophthora cactorum]
PVQALAVRTKASARLLRLNVAQAGEEVQLVPQLRENLTLVTC